MKYSCLLNINLGADFSLFHIACSFSKWPNRIKELLMESVPSTALIPAIM